MGKTIAVTGATGHLGNATCRLLCEQGFRVRALARAETPALEGLPLEIVRGDVLNPASLERLFAGCDAAIHTAAIISIQGDPDGSVFKTNTEGAANAYAAATRAGLRRFIHISSVHAVEELPHTAPFDESRPYKAKGAYAYDYSKATAEQILLARRDEGPELVILRPSAIIGPFDFKPSELGKAMLDLYRRKIPALPEGGYNFIDVRDVSRTIVNAIDAGEPGAAYHLTGVYYSMQGFARVVQAVTGVKTPQATVPYKLMRALAPLIEGWACISGAKPLFTREAIDAVKHGHPRMDNTKAAQALGHQCRPLETSVRDFYDWYQKQYGKI